MFRCVLFCFEEEGFGVSVHIQKKTSNKKNDNNNHCQQSTVDENHYLEHFSGYLFHRSILH